MKPDSSSLRQGTRERHDQLIKLVKGGTDRVADLAALLEVSPATVRRDLAHLNRAGLLTRTYGGATHARATFHERALAERMNLRQQEKMAIGQAAAALIPAGGTIFLDAGSTTAQIVGHIAEPAGLTVITRGLEIALLLAGIPGLTVIVLGGQVTTNSHGLVGPLTMLGLERCQVDVAFLGVDAVSAQLGVGEVTAEEAITKEVVARRARRTVVVADHSKLNNTDVPAWAPLPDGWTLVTDESAASRLQPFHQANVKVIIAP